MASSSSSSKYRCRSVKQLKEKEDLDRCGCGYESRMWISTTTKNPKRRFYKCPYWGSSEDCKHFNWIDPELTGYYKEEMNKLIAESKLNGYYKEERNKLIVELKGMKANLELLEKGKKPNIEVLDKKNNSIKVIVSLLAFLFVVLVINWLAISVFRD